VLTALFATCGISLTTFLVSAVLSLPNQFVNVYFGYALALRADGRTCTSPSALRSCFSRPLFRIVKDVEYRQQRRHRALDHRHGLRGAVYAPPPERGQATRDPRAPEAEAS
jgi:hypothetical protein